MISLADEQTVQLSITSANALSAAPNLNRNPMLMNIPSQFPYRATIGLDWADQKHDVFVRFANGDSYRRKIDSRPEAIQEWLLELRSTCGEAGQGQHSTTNGLLPSPARPMYISELGRYIATWQ
jgi:hypothetical protein